MNNNLQVDFQDYSELGYLDFEEDYIELYLNNKFVGNITVWNDDDREYIIINDDIIYLDDIQNLEDLEIKNVYYE